MSELAPCYRDFGFVLQQGVIFQNFCMIERRHQQRVQMRCAVSLWKPGDGTFTRTMTENLSSSGFFCLSSEAYQPGDELQATLEVPAPYRNGRHSSYLTLQCQVRVVRIQGRPSGLACRIEAYTVIPYASIQKIR
jgi:PilZ domain